MSRAMKRLVSAGVLLGLFAGAASAAPLLRPEAVVTGELVVAGDLIEGAGERAGVALFRAPDPGMTGAVPAEQVIAAARRAGIDDVSLGGLTAVMVTRPSRDVSVAEIQALVAARFAADADLSPEAVSVTVDQEAGLRLDPREAGPLQFARFSLDRATGRFEAEIEARDHRGGGKPAVVSGVAAETVETATLLRPLSRGDLLTPADFRIERRPRPAGSEPLAIDVAGLAARRPLREGQALRESDLMRPQHVQRGAFVTLIYAADGLSLSLKAKALAAGAAGDVISVQNLQSKRVVNGVVTGPSEVTVTAAATTVARR